MEDSELQQTGLNQPVDHQTQWQVPQGLKRLHEYRLILMPHYSSLAVRLSLRACEPSLSEQGEGRKSVYRC